MGAHTPQTVASIRDLAVTTNLLACPINAQFNAPTYGLIMDGITAIYMITRREILAENKKKAIELLTEGLEGTTNTIDHMDFYERLERQGVPINSGRAYISIAFPADFNYDGSNGVVIRDGILLKGILTKAHVGASSGSIIHQIARDYDLIEFGSLVKERLRDLLNDLSFLGQHWAYRNSISPKWGDCLLDPAQAEELDEAVKEKIRKVIEAGEKPDDELRQQIYEQQNFSIIKKIDAVADKLIKMDEDNFYSDSITSKAKGKKFNLKAMNVIKGQEAIAGGRPVGMIETKVDGKTIARTSPFVRIGSLNPKDYGLIESNFASGFNPQEYVVHAEGSRDGLLDTAVKTQSTGYLQRKVVGLTKQIRIYGDGTVRDDYGKIVQFLYGDDFFDGAGLLLVRTNYKDNKKSGRENKKFLSPFDGKKLIRDIRQKYGLLIDKQFDNLRRNLLQSVAYYLIEKFTDYTVPGLVEEYNQSQIVDIVKTRYADSKKRIGFLSLLFKKVKVYLTQEGNRLTQFWLGKLLNLSEFEIDSKKIGEKLLSFKEDLAERLAFYRNFSRIDKVKKEGLSNLIWPKIHGFLSKQSKKIEKKVEMVKESQSYDAITELLNSFEYDKIKANNIRDVYYSPLILSYFDDLLLTLDNKQRNNLRKHLKMEPNKTGFYTSLPELFEYMDAEKVLEFSDDLFTKMIDDSVKLYKNIDVLKIEIQDWKINGQKVFITKAVPYQNKYMKLIEYIMDKLDNDVGKLKKAIKEIEKKQVVTDNQIKLLKIYSDLVKSGKTVEGIKIKMLRDNYYRVDIDSKNTGIPVFNYRTIDEEIYSQIQRRVDGQMRKLTKLIEMRGNVFTALVKDLS